MEKKAPFEDISVTIFKEGDRSLQVHCTRALVVEAVARSVQQTVVLFLFSIVEGRIRILYT